MKPMNLLTTFLLIFVARIVPAQAVYELDFSTAEGNVKSWFKSRDWSFQGDILKMNPRFENGTLVLEAMGSDSGAFIFSIPDKNGLQHAHWISVEWGVEQYPEGADWSGPTDKSRNTRESIDVMISFGSEKISSGKWPIPGIPYFIGLFPADGEEAGKAYLGNYWQEGGCYFCISGNGTTEPISTHFPLSEKFLEAFGKKPPPITGIAIEVDAKNTKKSNGRHSKAWIRKITLSTEPPENK